MAELPKMDSHPFCGFCGDYLPLWTVLGSLKERKLLCFLGNILDCRTSVTSVRKLVIVILSSASDDRKSKMKSENFPVYVVDDDLEIQQSIGWVLQSVGYSIKCYASADEFLNQEVVNTPYCLVVDLLLPGMTGLKLCRELLARKSPCGLVIITGNGDVASAVEAMKLGAVDFLEKPFSRQRLLESIDQASQQVQSQYERQLKDKLVLNRIANLTPREREIFEAVAEGKATKTIAKQMDISTRTVDVHRSRVMQKLGITSPQEIAYAIYVYNRNEGLLREKMA